MAAGCADPAPPTRQHRAADHPPEGPATTRPGLYEQVFGE
jgi:hypothetical protein